MATNSPGGSRQLSSLPTARRSSRNAANPYERKRKQPTEETSHGISEAAKAGDSAPLTPRDPNITRSSPKKQKRMSKRSYLSIFKASSNWQVTAVIARSQQPTIPTMTKTKKVKESPFQKLQRLPDGCHPDFDNDHLCTVNNLREFWHKSQGAVFVDDKEHVMKTILFMLSVLPDACRPFLLVTTASLSLWKTKFRDFAPCINVVVYAGEKDVHNLIQNPDSHENGGHTMLHVLLAHPDALIEGIQYIESIGWEAVIVDYCQSSVLKHLEQLKKLATDFRMVLLCSPLKDNIVEYKSLLAFLHSEQDIGDYIDADALAILRARFKRHIAYERKACSSKFLEYWVPAYLSQAQLKQYSSLLLANSSILQSQTTTDNVKALRDIVMSLWKCCNHPCLVGLQHSPVNAHDVTESADDIMHNSGKLLLLDKMLKEIRNKRLRVIVLFQSDGEIGDLMGDILENFIRHRFGSESYERVLVRSAFSTKQEAMNMFNDTTKGRFVFLIDSRACLSSIKLSSVDTIIIYGSDLNPLNDLKALRNIKIDSQLKYVHIFRLYTPFTVEEKSLVLAKQSMIIDSNCQDIMPTLSHSLLSWGVSFLFSRVDELQQDNCASESCERGTVFMDKVILEFLTELSTDIKDSGKVNSPTISKAYMSGEFYSRNITLVGESDGVSSLDGDPPKFWLNLLNGKSHCQLYKRNETSTEETNEARRKLRKTGEIAGSSSESSSVIDNDLFPEIGTQSSADLDLLPETGVGNLSTPKSCHAELELELSKLTNVLKLPDNVHYVAKQFLEYLLKNHLVVREPPGTLHAFNIALCWRAASFLKYTKLDHEESAALAVNCLNYEYNEGLTGVIYKKLRILKKKVGHKLRGRRNKIPVVTTNLRSGHIFPKQAVDLHGNFTNGTQENQSASEQMVSDGQGLVSAPEADRDCHLSSEESLGRTTMKRIDLFNSIFCLRLENIMEKQQLEILNLKTQRDNQVMKLKEVCHAVVRHIRISDINEEIKNAQKKIVIKWFTMLMRAFLVHMKLQFAKLETLQSATCAEEKLMKEKLKHKVLSGQLDPFLDLCDNLPDSNFVVDEFIHFKKQIDDNHVDNILTLGCDQLLGDTLLEITLVQNPVPSEAFSECAVRNEPTEAHTRSGGETTSESLDLPDGNSDGVDPCSASAILATHDPTNQEHSTGEARNIEHAKRNNISNPSMLPGSATSLVMGINAGNDVAVAADMDHLELPILASPQNHMTLDYPPAEAEPTDTSLVMSAQDLQTGTHASCLILDAQRQGMCPDNSSKMNLELDATAEVILKGATSNHLGDSSVVVKDKNADTVPDPLNSENRSYIAPHVPAVLPDASEVETQTDQSNMPAQHSTDLSAQQNTAITGYPQAEAGPSSNLDTESAQSLQSDVQTSSSILDTLGILSARDVRPEVQPSFPMQDQPAEVEGAGTSGTIAAQNLQPETQSSTSVQHSPPERTHVDERIQAGLQPSSTLGPAPLTQLVTVPPAAVNNLSHSSEPLINELEKLKLWKTGLSKDHEQKISKLQAECNQEMEKVKKKFELILQKEVKAYHQSEKYIDDVYRKVFLQQSLAEYLGEKFRKPIPAQDVRPTIQQAPQSFQQAPTRMPVAQTSLPVASPLATRAPGLNSLYSTGLLQPSQAPLASASEAVQQPQPVLPGSFCRATPSPVSSMALRYGSYGRGPAPHLWQARMPAASAVARRDQQQLAAMSPGITSSRQPAPGILEGFPSVRALAGVPLTSMASSSVQQAMPSASNSLPALPESSPLSGSAPGLMTHFVQHPSTIPVAIAGQQASGLIPGFHHHMVGGSLNGVAGIAQAGGHLGGMNQVAPEPTREVHLLFQQQWAHALASSSSSVQQPVASALDPHQVLLASSTNRYLMAAQQALISNQGFGNMAAAANAAAGVWHRGAAPAAISQPDTPGPSSSRTGSQASGSSATAPRDGEVVCLSDDEEQ